MSISKTASFCGQCGANLNGDERFCGECGAMVSPRTISVPTSQPAVISGSPSEPEATDRSVNGPQTAVATGSAAPSVAQNSSSSSRRLNGSLGAILFVGFAAVATLAWFMPGWLFVPWEGAVQAKLIQPGETNLAEVVEVFGEYDRTGTYGANFEFVTFWPNRNSIAEATVWLDNNQTVRCLRITPSQPVPQKRFRKSFDSMENSLAISSGNLMALGSEPSGDTYHLMSGRYIYVVGEEVVEYWHFDLEKLDFDVEHVLREIHNEDFPQLDVWSGMPNSKN